METKKPWAIDLKILTPVAKAVYLHDVDVDPRCSDQVSGVSLSSVRKLLRASGRSERFASTRTTDHQVADRFTGNAGSPRSGAQSIEVCRSFTSSACSRPQPARVSAGREANEDLNMSESMAGEDIAHHWYAGPCSLCPTLKAPSGFTSTNWGSRRWDAGEGTVCQVDRGGAKWFCAMIERAR